MTENGFFRVAAAVPAVQPADFEANAASLIALLDDLRSAAPALVAFPEMSVTGYTCGDLFHSRTLLDGAARAIERLDNYSRTCDMAFVVGAPVEYCGAIYNCALVFCRGLVAAVPKTYVPNYNEFYEKRWWASAPEANAELTLCGRPIPFGTHLLVDCLGVRVGVEICEDMWTPIPPSTCAAMAGAEVIVNISASDDLIGKYDYLTSLIRQQSARTISGYVYASAGYGESSTDLVFDGKAIVA